jgi:hypothetical protein
MNTLRSNFQSSSRQLCITNARAQSNPLSMAVWSEQETADLVDYLYHLRSEISEGNFPPETFSGVAVYLNRRHPCSDKSRNLALSKFRSVKTFCYQTVCRLTSVL